MLANAAVALLSKFFDLAYKQAPAYISPAPLVSTTACLSQTCDTMGHVQNQYDESTSVSHSPKGEVIHHYPLKSIQIVTIPTLKG